MSRVFFIGDLHFGHKNITQLRPEFKSIHDHDEFIISTWNDKVKKNDLVFVLGDVAFTKEGLEKVKELQGRKILLLGNHDEEDIHRYLVFFETVKGLYPYKDETGRYWLSHAPIHVQELRGRTNIHGHSHTKYVTKATSDNEDWEVDDRYYNASCEIVNYEPKTTKELNSHYEHKAHSPDFAMPAPGTPPVAWAPGLKSYTVTTAAQVFNTPKPGDIS